MHVVHYSKTVRVKLFDRKKILLSRFIISFRKDLENKKINYRSALLLPFIFVFQFVSENRFYNRSNILHSNELVFDNYYLISKLSNIEFKLSSSSHSEFESLAYLN